MKNLIYKNLPAFIKSSSFGGILLLFCVALSLCIANSKFAGALSSFLDFKFGFESEYVQFRYSVLVWINDALMAVFFLFVGLEIKREIVGGQLSSVRKASLPVFAAIGGAALPGIIYLLINTQNKTGLNGWAIPMATDIAFALGVLSLLGNKVPSGLKLFLAALAIVDDLIAILIIAAFYSTEIHWNYFFYAGVVVCILFLFNGIGLKNIFFYVVPGILLWYFIHHSGIHATIAGVLTAMAIPTNNKLLESPLEKLEHILAKPVNFLIMPIFAIANTNITFQMGMVESLTGSVGLGIILGLFIGKPLGILLMSWLSVKTKLSMLPYQITWRHILGLGLLGGVGFTMSIFIALLSFKDPIYQTQAKFAILIASTLSGAVAYAFLKTRQRGFAGQ